jgi:adenine-specific DNA methylase
LNGILGDAVAGRKKVDEVISGVRREWVADPYGYPRAFSNPIRETDSAAFVQACEETWGTKVPTVLDSFAGGGSIPFEAVRLGLPVISNELNPVASIIERATIEYPMIWGKSLSVEIQDWGTRISKRVESKLAACFPRRQGETDLCYIWVRTVVCKDCELQVPLSPNWWLDTKNGLGYRLTVPAARTGTICTFTIIKKSPDFDPEKGTVAGGAAVCPRCSLPLDEDYIKSQAQLGKLGHQLAVVGFKISGRTGRFFRPASDEDLHGVALAERRLKESLPGWQAKGLVPEESIPEGTKTGELLSRGIKRWCDVFSPRQLLVHLTTVETILEQPWSQINDRQKREALRVYMAMALDKTLDWNSTGTTWHPNRIVLGHTFQQHNFAFKWSYGEIDGASQLWQFGVSQVSGAYVSISALMKHQSPLVPPSILVGDARSLPSIRSGSIEAAVIDPPYDANVMYAELADFFYVWLKRSLGDVFPALFSLDLTNKEDEAVANVARFRSAHRGKARDLAKRDYAAKMEAAFLECHRVLRDDGVLTVMFTHKKVEAWDALSGALFDAGFSVTASWPIHTESERSLHQAKKNAASSTILLVCRKRTPETGQGWWEDLQEMLDQDVHRHAEDYLKRGLKGQDIFIACFGPALKVISERWPVRTKDGNVIRPDEALDRARRVVADWFLDKIAEGKGKAVDPATRFYVLSWYIFQAREFPFDEARKLALSLGVDMEQLTSRKIVEKRGQGVRLLTPQDRVRTGALHPEEKSFDWDVDYVQAAIATYEEGKAAALSRFHQRTGALQREGYRAAVGLLLDVLPRVDTVGEYGVLDHMWQSSLQSQVTRRVQRTDPTGEKQRSLDQLSGGEAEDGADDEDEATGES